MAAQGVPPFHLGHGGSFPTWFTEPLSDGSSTAGVPPTHAVGDIPRIIPMYGVVCVPMEVDAFILNPSVCNEGLVRIPPITQPDYRGLRPNAAEIQHDILPHVDLHRTQPASINSRISEIEAPGMTQVDATRPDPAVPEVPPLRTNRIGVYLHWSLPRMYRAATGGTGEARDTGENTSPNPTFRLVPNRWAIIRTISSSNPGVNLDLDSKYKAWVIESDLIRKFPNLGADDDLETDMSPYVSYKAGDETNLQVLADQASVYIGGKFPLETWQEQDHPDDPLFDPTGTRVPLTIMNSSNISFADNTIHNANVFSMVDNLEYKDANGKTQYYTTAQCDYTIIGWHSASKDDPLGPEGLKGDFQARLDALFCTLDPSSEQQLWQQIKSSPTRTMCYGSIVNVRFDRNNKPPTPSEFVANLFVPESPIEPVSIGTTPLDSVLTFLQAYHDEATIGLSDSVAAKNILALSELLYAAEDNYNWRVKASDLVSAHNFASSSGGNAWHYAGRSGPGGRPAEPEKISADGTGLSQLDYLNKANDLQLQFDALKRKAELLQWSTFAIWWKAVSDATSSEPAKTLGYTQQMDAIRSEITVLRQLGASLSSDIEQLVHRPGQPGPSLQKVPATSIALPPFQLRKDPTLCIAGMDSGWSPEYSGKVLAKLSYDLYAAALRSVNEPDAYLQRCFTNVSSLDMPIRFGIGFILSYTVLSTVNRSADIGFKVWRGQPWRPLYIEWEAIYFHIPIEKWAVQLLSSPVGNNHTQVRYGVTEQLFDNPESTADQRALSGRVIISPQPVFSLHALVAQVLDTAGSPALTGISTDELLDQIQRFRLLSSELSGLTDHLLTLANGAHVQPIFQDPAHQRGIPLAAALAASVDFGITAADLQIINDKAGATPYGSLVDFSKSLKDPFKPVTHGQFRFTKLNIVDKFGQVISGIAPTPRPRIPQGLPATLHPCLGDQVCPGTIGDTGQLNTVTALTDEDPHRPASGYPLCPYIQLPPAINQPTRLNAAFLEKQINPGDSETFTGWKATTDWDQPVWAWMVVNYADYGLQFFTSDGTFYVELSLGGPKGSIEAPKWLPFDPPIASSPLVSSQLVELIKKMTDGDDGAVYLRSFWDMITRAITEMPYAPGAYSAYASSIIGKPLALVNVGFSLELATEPLQTQTTLPPPESTTPSKDLLSYDFHIKIGDADRPFDGVIGYYDTDNTTNGKTDWKVLHTYFMDIDDEPISSTADPRTFIKPETFHTLRPFYVDPAGPLKENSFAATQAQHFDVKTMIIDPYTPLHVYTPILPITSLQLPAWTVQTTLKKMSAFFRLGPILVTRDVPTKYNPSKAIAADSWVEAQQRLTSNEDSASIRLPLRAGKKGMWNWLQPYVVDGEQDEDDSQTGDTRYNAFDVGEEDGRLRLDPGPYTLIEGFLQLVQPLQEE